MSRATAKALAELHGSFARALKDILEAGTAGGEGSEPIGASHLNVIRQFLKDNNIDAVSDNPDLANLSEALKAKLPFTGEQDEYGPVQ